MNEFTNFNQRLIKKGVRRFNPNQYSSDTQKVFSSIPESLANSTEGTRQGVKRYGSSVETGFLGKKFCNYPSTPTKNLANNRLKRLRDSLNAQLEKEAKDQCSSSHEVVEKKAEQFPKPENSEVGTNVPESKAVITSTPISKARKSSVVSSDLTLIKSPSPDSSFVSPPKNIASSRLQRLKESLKVTQEDLQKTPEEIRAKKEKEKLLNKSVISIEDSIINISDTEVPFNISSFHTVDEVSKSDISTNTVIHNTVIRNTPSTLKRDISQVDVEEKKNKQQKTKHRSPLLRNNRICATSSNTKSTIQERLNVNSPNKNTSKADSSQDRTLIQEHMLKSLPNDIDSYKQKMMLDWIHTNQIDSSLNSNSSVRTNDSLQVHVDDNTLCNTNLVNDVEEMEWVNAEPDDSVFPLVQTDCPAVPKAPEKSKDIALIIDTNVFLHHLDKLEYIKNLKIRDSIDIKPVMHLPYMTLKELDYQKMHVNPKGPRCDAMTFKKRVLNAIDFINKSLQEQCPRFVGQTLDEFEQQRNAGTTADEKILGYYFQLSEKYETVVLLSADKNFQNIALTNKFTVWSPTEVIMRIQSKLKASDKFQKLSNKLATFLSAVICALAKETFGDTYLAMAMFKNPPWSLAECLKRLKKYWSSMLKQHVLKQCEMPINSLSDLLTRCSSISDGSEEFKRFIEYSKLIAIYLRDIKEFAGSASNIIQELQSVT